MIEDDPSCDSLVSWIHIVAVSFNYIESFNIKSKLAFSITLPAVNMNWFIASVGVEEETPAQDH